MIKTGGENVFPREVEETIQTIEGIASAVVIGIPHDRLGEVVTAAIVRDDESIDGDEIQEYCRSKMAGYKIPREIFIFDSLPQQGSQKIDREQIRAEIESRRS
jgi:acyl-CoA synthetase (AMP-forming)/AMP-acid ligase II